MLREFFTPEFFSAERKDPGLAFCVDGCDEPSYAEGLNEESQGRIRDQVSRMNEGIGRIVEPLMREG